jgi:hypothetical protein
MSTRLHLHQTWLGLVQPVEGLVVSAAVLADLESSNETPVGVRAAVLAAIEAHKASTGRDGVGVLALLGALGLHDACVITAPEELAAWYSGFSWAESYRKVVLAACREAIRAGASLSQQKVTEARLDDLARVHPAYLDYLTRHLQGRIKWEREFLAHGGMR